MVRKAYPKILGPRCDALYVCSGDRIGKRCSWDAKYTYNGRNVCWTHWMACHNKERDDGPVKFWERP